MFNLIFGILSLISSFLFIFTPILVPWFVETVFLETAFSRTKLNKSKFRIFVLALFSSLIRIGSLFILFLVAAPIYFLENLILQTLPFGDLIIPMAGLIVPHVISTLFLWHQLKIYNKKSPKLLWGVLIANNTILFLLTMSVIVYISNICLSSGGC